VISGVIYSTLQGLVGGRCYPNQFPQEIISPPASASVGGLPYPTWPAIRYQQIGTSNAPDICGTGTEDTDDSTFQLDVVARTHGAMRALVTQVITAMQMTTPLCTRDFFLEEYDEETKTHRGILRYTFYASSPSGVSP
jgi:hypothetical protein